MLTASFLSWYPRSRHEIASIADAYAIPTAIVGGGFIWLFRDGSSLVMNHEQATAHDADGKVMHTQAF